jgi:hypothetical protein
MHKSNHLRGWCGLLLSGAALWLTALSARADVAPIPSIAENGAALGPAQFTSVQMVTETVMLELDDTLTFVLAENGNEVERSGAWVTADFLFRNPEATAQTLPVGFPMLIVKPLDPNSFAETSTYTIVNLRAFVNEAEVVTEQILVNGEPWRAWTMTFAPGETRVRVTYQQSVGGEDFFASAATVGYVLHTGAGWAGVIEQADLIVRFPYPAEPLFVEDGQTGFTLEGNDLRWRYLNLEPTTEDDLNLRVVDPRTWIEVLAARRAVGQDPSAANYGALASAYSWIVSPSRGFYRGGPPNFYSRALAQVAEAQYQKAIALGPDDAQLRSDYAFFLASNAEGLLPADRWAEANAQYQQAILLDPNGNAAGDYAFLLEFLADKLPAGAPATATALIQTAVAQPTRPPATETPAPTYTLEPAATATLSATSVAQAATRTPVSPDVTQAIALPVITQAPPAEGPFPWGLALGFVVLFVAVVGGVLWLRRRK